MIPTPIPREPPQATRLHIVEDDPVVRQCLAGIVADRFGEVLVHCSAEEFLESYDRDRCCALLLDFSLPGMDGIGLLEFLEREHAMLPTLVMSADASVRRVVAAIRCGAVDFLPKPLDPRSLIGHVDALATQVRREASLRRLRQTRLRDWQRLTAREREVFDLLVRGASSKQIASHLGMQLRTAHIHRTNVLRKFGVETAVDLARIATLLRRATDVEIDDLGLVGS
jgi:two-component system CheB/CheR fusion protein